MRNGYLRTLRKRIIRKLLESGKKLEELREGLGKGWKGSDSDRVAGRIGLVVSVALTLLTGTQAGKEKHEMNIQKLLVCSEMWRGSPFSKTALASATSPTLPSHPPTPFLSPPLAFSRLLSARLTSSRPQRYRFCDTSWRKHSRASETRSAACCYQSKKGLKPRWNGGGSGLKSWEMRSWQGRGQGTREPDGNSTGTRRERDGASERGLCIS